MKRDNATRPSPERDASLPVLPDFDPDRLFRRLLLVICVLLACHLILGAGHVLLDSQSLSSVYRMFNLGMEYNVPAFTSASLWLLAAMLALSNAYTRPGPHAAARHWYLLSAVCVYLAFDEAIMLHEQFDVPVRALVDVSGVFHYAWFVLYAPLALLVVLFFLRFVLQLPEPVRNRIIGGGAVFVSGALGMELLESWIASTDSPRGIGIRISVTIEETLEMLGLSLFIHGLALHLRSGLNRIQIT